MQTALALLEAAEYRMPKVFSSVGKNPLNPDIDLAFAIIAETPGISLGDLLIRMKHSVRKEELIEVVDSLATMGAISVAPGPTYRAIVSR